MVLTRAEEEEIALWKQTVETLLEKGASPQDAIDGANLIVQAYRRKVEEAAGRMVPPSDGVADADGVGKPRR